MATIKNPKTDAVKQIYETIGGESRGWDYGEFEKTMLNDGGYRKSIYDSFGGEKEFGAYDAYNGYFQEPEKKKDIQPASDNSSAPATTNSTQPSTNTEVTNGIPETLKQVPPVAKVESVIKPVEKDEFKIEADKLENGQIDNLDFNKVMKFYEKADEKPSSATLQKVKEYSEVKAQSVADQSAKMETLAAAIESASADLENVKTTFPEMSKQMERMQQLSALPQDKITAADEKEYKELFEKTTIPRGVIDQRQKVATKLFEQYTALNQQLKSDVAELQGANQFYGENNYWYDKGKSLTENLKSVGRSFERGVVMGQANVLKQMDGLSKIIGDVTNTTPSGIFGRLADKLKGQVEANINLNDDVETVATKLSESTGGMMPMFTELMLTPELKIKGFAVPKFVTYMAYSTALDKFNARADKLAEEFSKPYEELPMDLKTGAYGELLKGGVIGAGEGAVLHTLNLGAMRYGSNMATRAALSGGVFAGYDAVKQKIQNGTINDKDVVASFLLGSAMSLQAEATGGGPKTKERVGAVKDFWSTAMKAPEKAVEGPLFDAYLQTRPELVTELEKIQQMPSEADRIEKIDEFRKNTLEQIPDEFKRDFFESNDIMKGEEFDFLKLNKQEADKNAADFENSQPRPLQDIATEAYRGNPSALKDVFDFGRVLNKYQLKKDATGLKDFVSDGLSIEATPAELMEIQAIMKDNYVDFIRAKSAGNSIGADEAQWNEKLKDIFGDGNTRLLDVLGKMNSRQRALLLAKLIDTQKGEILKPTTGKPAVANDLGTGKTADIPVEGGGKFRVTLAEKIAHVISAKSLKDIYGFNYNKDASNASRTFWQMSRETARESMTNENLAEAGEAAEDLITSAAKEQNPEVAQAQRVSAQFIQQVININREGVAIAQDPEKYIAAIRDDETLTQPQREEYYKMIDDVLQNKGAIAAQASIISQQIQQLQADMNSIPSEKLEPERKAIAEHIAEQIEAKTAEIKDLYANYKPAADRAKEMPVDEFTPEQEQKLKKAVEGSDELRGELLDILRIKEPAKKQAKISEFKKKVLTDLEKAPAEEKKPESVAAKKADIERRREENDSLGKSILQKLGYKNENRLPNGNVKGGQAGWKIRFNIKNPKTGESYYDGKGTTTLLNDDYDKRAETLINFLLNYFGSNEKADSKNLQKHYVLEDKDGTRREPFKHLSGGEIGESDFTIYIGSADDVMKFISDIRTRHPEILKLLHAGNKSEDLSIDDIFKGRIEGSKIGFSGYHAPTNLNKVTSSNDFTFNFNQHRVNINYNGNNLSDIRISVESSNKGYVGVFDKDLKKDFPELYKNIRNIVGFQLYGNYLQGSNDEFLKLTGVDKINAKYDAELSALEEIEKKPVEKKEEKKVEPEKPKPIIDYENELDKPVVDLHMRYSDAEFEGTEQTDPLVSDNNQLRGKLKGASTSEKKAITTQIRENELKITGIEKATKARQNEDMRQLKNVVFKAAGNLDVPLTDGDTIKIAQNVMDRITNKAAKNWDIPLSQVIESAILDFGKEDEPAKKVSKTASPTEVSGGEAEVRLADNTQKKARFAAVEADELLTSHDPFTFNESKDFPTKNDRDYSLKENQANVLTTEKQYDTRGISDNPGVAEGSPVVTWDADLGKYVVLSGNERVMAFARALKHGSGAVKKEGGKQSQYESDLAKKAARYGLDSMALVGMKNPVFVRVIEEPVEYSTAEMSKYNPRAVGKTKSAKEMIGTMREKISDEQRERLARIIEEADADKLSEIWNNPKVAKILYDYLIASDIIDIKEVPSLFLTKGEGARVFTETGKELFKTILASGIIDEKVLQYKDVVGVTSLYNTITSGLLVPLFEIKKNNPALIKTINDALLLQAKTSLAGLKSVAFYLNQGAMFEDKDIAAMSPGELAEAAEMLIIMQNVGVENLRAALIGLNDVSAYNKQQRANPGMFSSVEVDEAQAFQERMAEWRKIAEAKIQALLKDKSITNDTAKRETELLAATQKDKKPTPAKGPADGGKKVAPVSKKPETKEVNGPDIDDIFDELDSFNVAQEDESPYGVPEIKAEQIATGQKLIKALTGAKENAIYKFDDMLAYMVGRFGEDRAMRNFDAIKMAYGAFLAVAPDEITNKMTELAALKKMQPADILTKIKQNGNPDLADTGGTGSPGVDGGMEQGKVNGTGEDGAVENLPDGDSGKGIKGEGDGDGAKPKRIGGDGDSNGQRPSTGSGGKQRTGSDERKGVADDTKQLAVDELDHVITPQQTIVPKGETARINANIDAIKLLRQLEADNRNATPAEKNILAQFTGFGGFGEVLNRDRYLSKDAGWMKKYGKLHEEIAGLLSEKELTEAINSTISAHYTPREVISSLWDLVGKLGFKGGHVLESSAGVGHIFGLMPVDMHSNSRLTGFELDGITGRIFEKLYPQAKIKVKGFEFSELSPNSVDLAITNVPFGRMAPYDSSYPELSKFSLHNYFIAKNILMLKPGGIGVFITSASTLDNGASAKFREWANKEGNADFVGAIRLPNNAFKENAGTEVTADILVFRKRTGDIPSAVSQEFRYTKPIREVEYEGKQKNIEVNEYFANHPEMMLGEMKFASEAGTGGLYRGDSQTLVAPSGQDTQLALQQAISKLPQDVFGADADVERKVVLSDKGDKTGTLKVKDGQVYQVFGDELRPVTWSADKIKYGKKEVPASVIAKQYIDIKDSLNKLLDAELSKESTDENIEALRGNLRKAYRIFTENYGTLNKPGRANKVKFLEDDVEFDAISAIESVNYKYENTEGGKLRRVAEIVPAQILTKRVNYPIVEPEKAEDAADAMLISSSYRNKIDLPYIARLLDMPEDRVKAQLLSEGLAFENPATGLLEDKDSYLSGFVRDKLKMAKSAAAANTAYANNVTELEKVIPADIPPLLIKFKLGTPWMPPHIMESWVGETLGVNARMFYNKQTGLWIAEGVSGLSDGKNAVWGTNDFSGWELVEKALNLGTPSVSKTIKNADGGKTTVKDVDATAAAQAKQAELMDNFVNWVRDKGTFDDEIGSIYNETYNGYVEKKYSLPVFDHYPGASVIDKKGRPLKLRLHQKKAVTRILQDSTLLAHQVGTGKTYTIATAAMEMKRLGRAKKPIVIVQNATVGQFADAFRTLYPQAKLLVPSANQRDASNRRKLFAMIAYNDWDSVIIPQSFASFIPDDPDRVNGFIQEQIDDLQAVIDEIDDGSYESRGRVNELTKAMEKLEEQRRKSVHDNYVTAVQNLIEDLHHEGSDEAVKKAEQLSALVTQFSNMNERTGLTREDKAQYISDIISKMKGEIENSSQKIKDIARQQLAIERSIRKQSDRKTDEVMTFEKMGIDAMFYDEAHANKKLGFFTKMSNIKGVDTGRSQRAFSTYMKAQWIQELNQGKNVTFATGTPITNTMAEVWTMMKFIQPDILEKYKISNFDQFASTFGAVEPSLEFTAAGKFKMVERFKSYINAPELLTAFRSKTDVVLTEDIPEFKEDKTIPKLKPTNVNYVAGTPYFNGIPLENISVTEDTRQAISDAVKLLGGKPERSALVDYFTNTSPNQGAVEFLSRRGFTNIIIPQSEALKQQMDEFRAEMEWFEKLTGKEKRKYRHIPLLIFNRAKQAAIDLRLLDPEADDDPGSKTNKVVEQVLERYNESTDIKGTQLVFSDMYQSPAPRGAWLDEEETIPNPAFGKSRFNLYHDIKKKLIAGGIPENEIVIIHDLGTGKSADAKRARVFEMMQQGRVRVMLGSTEKMGVGVNVQDKMVALHHVDAPPRPMDFEQRNGRGLRQGNELAYLDKDFDIVTYGVAKTLDATAYGRLAIKQKFINQMMKGEGLDREMNDEADEDNPADMSFEQRMAALSGSQYAVIWHAKTYELRKLETSSKNHERRLIQLNGDLKNDKLVLESLKARVPEINQVVKDVNVKIPVGIITTLKRGETTYTEKFATVVDSVIQGLIIKSVQDGKKHLEQIEVNGVPVLFTSNIIGGERPSGIAVKPEDVAVSYALDPHFPERYYDHYLSRAVSAGVGFINSMRSRLDFIATEARDIHNRIKKLEERIPVIESELKKPFTQNDKLSRLRTEVAEVEEKMKEEVINKAPEKPEEVEEEKEDEDNIVEEAGEITLEHQADLFSSAGFEVPEKIKEKIKRAPSKKKIKAEHIDIAYGGEKELKEAIASLPDRSPAGEVYVAEVYENGSLVKKPLSIRENSVKQQLEKTMSFNINGALIDSPETLADIFTAIRNPHMEIAAVVYLRKGEVVHSSFQTLGLPEMTIFASQKSIVETSFAMGADEIMVVHNHPSGNHKASQADILFTQRTADMVRGSGIKFGGHVVIDTDKFSFISGMGYVEEKEHKNPVESFHYERAKIGIGYDAERNMFLVAEAVLKQKGLKTAIVYLSAANHIHGFEPISNGELNKPDFVNRLVTNRSKYGASRYIIVTDGEPIKGTLPYGLLDVIDIKSNKTRIENFPVKVAHESNIGFLKGGAAASLIVNEDDVMFGGKLEDLFKDDNQEKQLAELNKNIEVLSKDLAKALKVHEGFLLKQAELKPKQVAKKVVEGMTQMAFIPPGAIKAAGTVSSRLFNAPNRIDLGLVQIPVQDFLSDKIVGGFEEWLAKRVQEAATSRSMALRELSDLAVGWLRGVIDDNAYVKSRGEMKGGIATGGEAANRMGKALREIVGNNPGSLEKVISIMDPELHLHFGTPQQAAYEGLAADKARLYKEIYDARRLGLPATAQQADLSNVLADIDTLNNVGLTPEEITLKSLLTTLNTVTHDTNRMMGIASGGTMGINQDTWEKFRNPVTGKADYIARSYNWTEEDEDSKALTQQIMAEMGIYKGRTDVTMDKVLEAIKDPVYLTVKRYAQTMKNLSIFEYSRELFAEQTGKGVLTSAQFMAKFGTAPSAKIDHGYVRMPGFGYGLLSNKWVAKHYAEDLKGYMYNTYLMQKFNDVAQAYDSLWLRRMYRAYFTVLNPGVIAGNVAMNYVWAFKAGINPVAFMGMLPKAVMEIRNGGPAYLAMLRNGLIGNNISLANLQGEAASKKGFLNSAKGFYSGVDDVAKIQAYMVLTDLNGYTPEEAIGQIRDSFQTSEEVGRYWDLAAKTPLIGNMFARFVAQAIRIEKNNVVKRPLYTIAWYSFLSWLTFALMSGDEDNEELSKEEKGVWKDFATSVPRSAPTYHYDNADKQWKWGDMPLSMVVNGKRLDIARFVEPLYIWDQGDDYQSYIQWINKASPYPFKGEKTDNGIRKLKFMYSDPILGPLFQAMDDQDFRMRSVQDPSSGKWGYDVNLDDNDRLKNIASYLTRAYGGQYVALIDDLWNASRGEPDRYGRYKTVSDAILNLLVKVQRFDDKEVGRAVEKRMKTRDREFENLKFQLNNTLDQYHRDISEIVQDEKRSQEQKDKAMKAVTDKYYSANEARYAKVLDWMVETKKDIDEVNTLADNTKYEEFREIVKDFKGDEKYVPTLRGRRGMEQKKKGKQGKLEELREKAEQAVTINREEIQQLAEEEVLKGKDNEERARLIFKNIDGKDAITQQQMIKNYIHRGVITNQTLIYLNRLRK